MPTQEQYDAAKREAYAKRVAELQAADFSAAGSVDELYNGLSVTEIKLLDQMNASFKKRLNELNTSQGRVTQEQLIAQFRAMTPDDQQRAYAQMPPESKAVIDADYDAFIAAHQTLSPSQDEIDAAKAAEAAAQTPAVTETPVVQTPVVQEEKLYDGVEKLADGTYKLTVDPEDGSPLEIFYGVAQADCFKALRKSKASATRELRRRKNKLLITDDLRNLPGVEKLATPSFVQPVIYTPDQLFILTEQLKDPATVVEAQRKLSLVRSPDECQKINDAIERQRYNDGFNIYYAWLQIHSGKDYYDCPENLASMQKLMGDLDWAMTLRNMDLAVSVLRKQGVLLELPEEPATSVQPVAQPASVVPVAAAPVVTPAPAQASAAPTIQPPAPAAPAGALPAADRVLRPASSTGMPPTRRFEPSTAVAHVPVLTAEEYHAIPASTMKMRYQREPAFKAQVDALIASGKV